jgi:hypothetical protein
MAKKKSTKKEAATKKVTESSDKLMLLDLEKEGLTELAKVLKLSNPINARLVKSGRTVFLMIHGIIGRRMKLHNSLVLLGETIEEVAKVKLATGEEKAVEPTVDLLERLTKIEQTFRAMLSEKTRVRFEVE